jgi:hypothetical protein
MHFLVIDDRFMVVTHVFLACDPAPEDQYPGLPVRRVTLLQMSDLSESSGGQAAGADRVVGRYPEPAALFRVFDSDRSVAEARFVLIPSSYIGDTWADYVRERRPGGW